MSHDNTLLDTSRERQKEPAGPRAIPQQITEEEWDDKLNVLPPISWRHIDGVESFTMSEVYCDDVYWRYVRIGDRRWSMLASIKTPVRDLAQLCIAQLATASVHGLS
ncbi:hypothetical protein H8Z72_22540 (plasmid) [Xanthomonas citri pv. citri]|uniref:hypothetical protein n=1 Tax=Xanthomonas citri TaxID=346 RepID=UPI001932A215|nr:hypothetical protein [Xanthomonas citri]QRD62691.1 hypothetical protein H8Z74_22540 [Xanthomonas citri pv. citri]QRD67226.1 hypothetical protein H8Z73_22625 [Xanthomonas citri pv. citri]QRD71729.1 hypothetical protein H8Z72_22540 [Xanthomonas citri pv. citri]